jgi:hypothetical protein
MTSIVREVNADVSIDLNLPFIISLRQAKAEQTNKQLNWTVQQLEPSQNKKKLIQYHIPQLR